MEEWSLAAAAVSIRSRECAKQTNLELWKTTKISSPIEKAKSRNDLGSTY